MKLINNGRETFFVCAALAACLVFTINAQAQTCVVTNWQGGQPGLSNDNAGFQEDGPDAGTELDNRRYGGPCGLRVPVDGTARYVVDTSPDNESNYNARFYAFLNAAGKVPIRIFEASDGSANQIEIWYNRDAAGVTAEGALSMIVAIDGGGSTGLDAGVIGSGWHSIEFVWTRSDAADLILSVDGVDTTASGIDTDIGGTNGIADAALGNLNPANTGGTIDFDDFDSRRMDRPGRLLRGDANDDLDCNVLDVQTILNEANTVGTASPVFASGQPDCTEDGSVNVVDVQCILNRANNSEC